MFHQIMKRALIEPYRKAIDAILLDDIREWNNYERRRLKNGTQKGVKLKKKPIILDDYLTTDDWVVLTAYHTILRPFHEVTRRLEDNPINGEMGALWEVLPVIEFLLEHLEAIKRDIISFPNNKHFCIGVNLGWTKLDEYYRLLDDLPVYTASIALHPAFGQEWIESKWSERQEQIKAAKQSVRRLQEKEYKHLLVNTSRGGGDEPPARKRRKGTPTEFDAWLEATRVRTATTTIAVDEYTSWQSEPLNPVDYDNPPLQYWAAVTPLLFLGEVGRIVGQRRLSGGRGGRQGRVARNIGVRIN